MEEESSVLRATMQQATTYRAPKGVRSHRSCRKRVRTDSPSGEASKCAEGIFMSHTFNAKTHSGEERAMMALNWLVSDKWSLGQTVQDNTTAKEQNQSTLYIPIKFLFSLIFAKTSDFILEISLPRNKMVELIWVLWKHFKAFEKKARFPNLEF